LLIEVSRFFLESPGCVSSFGKVFVIDENVIKKELNALTIL